MLGWATERSVKAAARVADALLTIANVTSNITDGTSQHKNTVSVSKKDRIATSKLLHKNVIVSVGRRKWAMKGLFHN